MESERCALVAMLTIVFLKQISEIVTTTARQVFGVYCKNVT